jgi:diguanylate cyclase (GGDEF)-like protein/PAS domain S-box-containing protein
MKKIPQLGPILRLSVGIISLMLALVLVADSVFHIWPNERQQQMEVRKHVGKLVGGEIAHLLGDGDHAQWEGSLHRILAADADIHSIGVRRTDRTLVAASTGHEQLWAAATENAPSQQLVIPLYLGKHAWGEIQLLFVEPTKTDILHWIRQPEISLILLFSTFGFVGVYFYLKRALYYLDPSNAMPQRVRKAFDTLTQAIVVLNNKGQIMLGNDTFHQMHEGSPERLEGKPIKQIGWLMAGLSRNSEGGYPWDIVLHTNQTIEGKELKVSLPDGTVRELTMNCSAINDGSGTARGCLISFEDVTPIRESNRMLQNALADLQSSKDKIQQQNEELQKFAHFDPLTSCLNRRAFFQRTEPLFQNAVANGTEISCIMVDIDHFKSFNDQYGHAVGDLVIQQVAKTVEGAIRSQDFLCRYGGEEFCVVLADTGAEIGLQVAERLRMHIERDCGPGVRTIEGLRITASFGFASLQAGPACATLSKLIERADEGLYVAKRGGRNRVACVDSQTSPVETPVESA